LKGKCVRNYKYINHQGTRSWVFFLEELYKIFVISGFCLERERERERDVMVFTKTLVGIW
jgi:hypothetical protein